MLVILKKFKIYFATNLYEYNQEAKKSQHPPIPLFHNKNPKQINYKQFFNEE